MNARELRIGNYLQTKDKKITSVTDIVSINGFEDISFMCFGYDESQVEPIPITEEWLLKFGFEVNSPNERWMKDNCGFEVIFYDIGFNIYKGGMFFCDEMFHYVHQLQNLYFSLTGEELELKQ